MNAEVYRHKYTDACNLLRNTSKSLVYCLMGKECVSEKICDKGSTVQC